MLLLHVLLRMLMLLLLLMGIALLPVRVHLRDAKLLRRGRRCCCRCILRSVLLLRKVIVCQLVRRHGRDALCVGRARIRGDRFDATPKSYALGAVAIMHTSWAR